MKGKAKALAEDSMVEVTTKELYLLGIAKVNDSEMFAWYVIAEETKA